MGWIPAILSQYRHAATMGLLVAGSTVVSHRLGFTQGWDARSRSDDVPEAVGPVAQAPVPVADAVVAIPAAPVAAPVAPLTAEPVAVRLHAPAAAPWVSYELDGDFNLPEDLVVSEGSGGGWGYLPWVAGGLVVAAGLGVGGGVMWLRSDKRTLGILKGLSAKLEALRKDETRNAGGNAGQAWFMQLIQVEAGLRSMRVSEATKSEWVKVRQEFLQVYLDVTVTNFATNVERIEDEKLADPEFKKMLKASVDGQLQTLAGMLGGEPLTSEQFELAQDLETRLQQIQGRLDGTDAAVAVPGVAVGDEKDLGDDDQTEDLEVAPSPVAPPRLGGVEIVDVGDPE